MAKWKEPLQLDLFCNARTSCAHCNRELEANLALRKEFVDESNEKQEEHFCGEECHQSWHIDRLNQMGL